jgi:hypothetical protein
LVEEFPGQDAIGPHAGLGARNRTEIDAEPDDLVGLVEHDPGRFVVETEVALDLWREGDGSGCVGWCVSDGDDTDPNTVVGFAANGEDNP